VEEDKEREAGGGGRLEDRFEDNEDVLRPQKK